ncbi:MAG: pilin [Lysobacteraceae bacterium]
MSAPPPIPPSSRAQPPPAPAPKTGMSGCAIAGIIGAVVAVLGVFVISILAAIAIPAYQDYVIKSRVVQAWHMAQELQDDVDTQREQSGVCPDNAAIGLADDEVFALGGDNPAAPAQATVLVGEIEGGHCGIELQFANVNAVVDGKTLLLESTENGWTCEGGTLGARYRTGSCRNFIPSP